MAAVSRLPKAFDTPWRGQQQLRKATYIICSAVIIDVGQANLRSWGTRSREYLTVVTFGIPNPSIVAGASVGV